MYSSGIGGRGDGMIYNGSHLHKLISPMIYYYYINIIVDLMRVIGDDQR